MSDDRQAGDDGYKVGPGNPPREHRFKKGEPSRNPLGCPPKPKRQDSLLATLDPWAAAVVKFDNAVIGKVGDGADATDVTRREHRLGLLYERVRRDDAAAWKLYTQLAEAAHEKAQRFKADMLLEAVAHRKKHLVQFIRYEEAGRALPAVFPDPRDVIIGPDGTVRVEGPTDEVERARQYDVLEMQVSLLDAIGTLQRYKQGAGSEAAKRQERKLKRKPALVNKALPSRLRRLSTPVEPSPDEEGSQAPGGSEEA